MDFLDLKLINMHTSRGTTVMVNCDILDVILHIICMNNFKEFFEFFYYVVIRVFTTIKATILYGILVTSMYINYDDRLY